ncbi:unnamed protein product [Darwinula stevensoni]|uniref:DNA-directed RNA polymerase n=1 Tax=Darwinula stevensoni TaxID=69355 RepID=A0A7R8XEQ0_9CRUS|nr:unnamed protein product [Darwinula stevensoni]CAG0894441.1 unnamed protein product [Darwinula stevensoni]
METSSMRAEVTSSKVVHEGGTDDSRAVVKKLSVEKVLGVLPAASGITNATLLESSHFALSEELLPRISLTLTKCEGKLEAIEKLLNEPDVTALEIYIQVIASCLRPLRLLQRNMSSMDEVEESLREIHTSLDRIISDWEEVSYKSDKEEMKQSLQSFQEGVKELKDQVLRFDDHSSHEEVEEQEDIISVRNEEGLEKGKKRKGKDLSLSAREREKVAKMKMESLERAGKEVNLARNLKSYLEVCVAPVCPPECAQPVRVCVFLEFVKSEKGKDLLVLEGYLLTQKKMSKDGQRMYWECLYRRYKGNCNFRATTEGEQYVSRIPSSAKRSIFNNLNIADIDPLQDWTILTNPVLVHEEQIHIGKAGKAKSTLVHYVNKAKVDPHAIPIRGVQLFNIVLHALASKGDVDGVREVMQMMAEEKISLTEETFIAALLSIAVKNPKNKLEQVTEILDHMHRHGLDVEALFQDHKLMVEDQERILEAICCVRPGFHPLTGTQDKSYSCQLLHTLNNPSHKLMTSPAEGVMTVEELEKGLKEQLELELSGQISIKSVEAKPSPSHLTLLYRTRLKECEEKWRRDLRKSFMNGVGVLELRHKAHPVWSRSISILPYLHVLSPDSYVDIMIQEIHRLAEGSETFSPSTHILYKSIAAKVMHRYKIQECERYGVVDSLRNFYTAYSKFYLDSHECRQKLPREFWQEALEQKRTLFDLGERSWPPGILYSIGKFLYSLMMREVKFDAFILKKGKSMLKQEVPAFYSIFRRQGHMTKEEVKTHPTLMKLYRGASLDDLTFDAQVAPMLCPPLPWISHTTGGFLLSSAPLIRLPFGARAQMSQLEQTPVRNLYPVLDSLNQLGSIPWIVNDKVLNVVVDVFNKKGDEKLEVPPPPSECPPLPSFSSATTKQERHHIHRQRLALQRKKAEMFSLWCDALYKLSIAHHFRGRVIWFPYNMDFRGRVYPCPPHFNHLGADLTRSLLLFAQGKPLGDQGLNWLKIHVVNLTGKKKRSPISERLAHANEVMPEILDSAENPLSGRRWWMESEEPWQTLAACMELREALMSPNPSEYISHLPIHQDGSCNGLQHYAALGRDLQGAQSVNLAPLPNPQDVYSDVAAIVERERAKDAKEGVVTAKVLEGFVRRKVIKQTIMTTVYGVTRFGARLQIAKQLKDIEEFPQEHQWAASYYLVQKTFLSLQEMFTATRHIQDWLTECARLISAVCGQSVEWVTPLGFPIIQPYHRGLLRGFSLASLDALRSIPFYSMDAYERPNVMKQKNAFPPNFIHSLDSCHMMLTSLFCQSQGLSFVSIHDCFWTHASTVDRMNQICREQFVALHSEPILEDLSRYLIEKYSYSDGEFVGDGSVVEMAKRKLNRVLHQVPAKGSFNLQDVLHSTYFFS